MITTILVAVFCGIPITLWLMTILVSALVGIFGLFGG